MPLPLTSLWQHVDAIALKVPHSGSDKQSSLPCGAFGLQEAIVQLPSLVAMQASIQSYPSSMSSPWLPFARSMGLQMLSHWKGMLYRARSRT